MSNTFEIVLKDEEIKKALKHIGFTTPTPIQKDSYEAISKGQDTFLHSQTGSGKTASFLIPILENINWDEYYPQCLIVTPTRELALQIQHEVYRLGKFKRIKSVAIYGKHTMEYEVQQLSQRTHIVVATPGRLLDHIEKNSIQLDNIQYLVIDETDELMSLGFHEQIDDIYRCLPSKLVNVYASATLNDEVNMLLQTYTHNLKVIEGSSKKLEIDYTYSYESAKTKALALVSYIVEHKIEQSIIFCNTKEEVKTLCMILQTYYMDVKAFYGDLAQKERIQVLKDFKEKKVAFLVSTNIISRGIDIEKLDTILHYDVASNLEQFTHRSGRTARNNEKGSVHVFVDETQKESFLKFHPLDEMKETKTTLLDKQQIINYMKQSTLQEFIPEKVQDGSFTLHIAAGKKDKLRAGDVVGSICSLEGIEMKDIGIIDILQNFTYVEILNHKGDSVLKKLQQTPIKGKLRKVQEAK